MNNLWPIVIITAIAGIGGTGIGGFVGAILRKDSKKVVSLLLSFAGGVMLAVVCFDLIQEAFHPEGAAHDISVWLIVSGVLFGYLIIFFLNYLIDKKTNPEVSHIDNQHPQTADDLDELIHADHYNEHKNERKFSGEFNKNHDLLIAGIVMAFAIALHNMPEGMVIGASFALDTHSLLSGAGFIMAIVIGIHNIPEGMAVSVPLISGGITKWKAIGITAISGVPTIIGAIMGYWVGLISPLWLALSLSSAGGAMLYVVFGELLPEAILMWKSKLPALFTLIGTLVGLILVRI